ncbi:NAD-dependent epimerase/dehydratase family protein [Algoriphagus sp. PAP.12]|uniref:NAD-dependent epimerase/dehydratase family protein n=1 Tax=Algoriphagus sp. PAP.12 TaxID=2996678 RepID=UPI00227B5473|nr:NAD-dependent epimerase/dehydratase family protein [Algoriphagus sp. PAP.12]
MKVILTGATGMVGEGVLMECLDNPLVTEILVVGRRSIQKTNPKLSELIVPDFLKIKDFSEKLVGYDACFFCAGISSVGMKEEDYVRVTYDTTLAFAKTLLQKNPDLVFNFVSGQSTDSSENGRVMWARVKGKTENHLIRLGFKGEYNFRPGVMLPVEGQNNSKSLYVGIAKIMKFITPKLVLSIGDIGKAMINIVLNGYPKQVLEIKDIRTLAQSSLEK